MVRRKENITTPQVQVQQADLTTASMTAELSQFAFNTADVLKQKANHAHELNFKNQAQEEINAIFERNQTDPAQFQKEAQAAQRGLIKSAPLFMRDTFKQGFEAQAKPYLNKVTANHEKQLTDEIKFSTLKRIDLAKQSATVMAGGLFSDDPVQVADSGTALQELIMDATAAASAVDGRGMPVLTAEQRFNVGKDFVDDVAYSSVRAGYDDTVDKQAYLDKFISGELEATIFLNEEGEFIQRSVRDGMDRKTFERTRNYMETDIAKLEAEAKKAAVSQGQLDIMQKVRSGEFVLDAKNKDHQKAVDTDYAVYSQQIAQLPLEQQSQAEIDYVADVGVYPKELESKTRAWLTNGNAEQRARAADIIEQIAERRPSTKMQISSEDRVLARQITENLNAGIDAEQAIAFADSKVFEKDTEAYKVRLARFKDEQKEFSAGAFTEFFRDDPSEIPDAMKADYNVANRKLYMDGGLSAESAKQLAEEQVAGNWGINRTGGQNRWMKYAPEKMYDNGVDPQWMSDQLAADTGIAEGLILEVAPETVTQPDPHYLVFQQNDFGELIPLFSEDGKQQVWKPDFQSSPMFTQLQAEYDGDVEAAMVEAKRQRNQAVGEARQKSIREGF